MKSILFLFTLVCFLFACEKAPPVKPAELPAMTTEGKNTFGCLLNGELWVPGYKNNGWGAYELMLHAHYDSLQNYVHCSAQQYANHKNISAAMSFALPFQSGITKLNDSNCTFWDHNRAMGKPLSIFSGSAEIVFLDKVNRIIAGTFSFDAAKNGDTVRVRDGRFDLKYYRMPE